MEIKNLDEPWQGFDTAKFKSYQQVIVGHSGGIDSTALLHVIYQLAKKTNFHNLSVCHVNFGLREKDSDFDAEFVRQMAADLSLKVHLLEVDSSDISAIKNVQNWARETRRRYFEKIISKFPADRSLVALGHHKMDQAETILFRLIRGTRPENLKGMKLLSPPYWRPFLNQDRSALKAYLIRNNLQHRHDKSNDTLKYDRNRIRLNVWPELNLINPNSCEHVIDLANEVDEYSTYVLKGLETDLQLEIDQSGVRKISSKSWKSLTAKSLKLAGIRVLLGKNSSHKLSTLENIFDTISKNKAGKMVIQGKQLQFDPEVIYLDPRPKTQIHPQHHSLLGLSNEQCLNLMPKQRFIVSYSEKIVGKFLRIENCGDRTLQIRIRRLDSAVNADQKLEIFINDKVLACVSPREGGNTSLELGLRTYMHLPDLNIDLLC